MPPKSAIKADQSSFETQGRCHRKSKTEISVAPEKDIFSKNIFKNLKYSDRKSDAGEFELMKYLLQNHSNIDASQLHHLCNFTTIAQ